MPTARPMPKQSQYMTVEPMPTVPSALSGEHHLKSNQEIRISTITHTQLKKCKNDEMFIIRINAIENTKFEIHPVFSKFNDRFPDTLPKGLPPSRPVDHKILLTDDIPVTAQGDRRFSPKELDSIRENLEKWVELGHISPSTSPYASHVVLVRKKDGSIRMCIDYRALNKKTVRDNYQLPLVDNLLDVLHGAKVFSKLDLMSGYNQILVDEADREKTAFTTRFGLFQFNVLPFGLCNAPATFMRLMNNIFMDQLDRSVIVYLDDILVFSKDEASHAAHLDWVMNKLREHSLYANKKKCMLGVKRVEFLGFVISENGICAEETKIEKIKNWPTPTDASQVRSFLGVIAFYRRFIRNCSEIALALTNLTRDNVEFHWGEEEESAFRRLIQALLERVVLKIPDPKRPYTLYTDASGKAVGAALMQDGRIVGFDSKKLTDIQTRWPIREQEIWAIVNALKVFRPYLHGAQFTVFTDHKSIESIFNQKELTPRVARWLDLFAEYEFNIKYIPGEANVVADSLSRLPVNSISTQQITGSAGIKVITSCEEQDEIVRKIHESFEGGHLGRDKTLQLVKRSYFWRGITNTVAQVVARCKSCQMNKASNQLPSGLLQPIEIPEQRWETITMDMMTHLPKTQDEQDAIMVFEDKLTKQVYLHATSSTATAEDIAEIFFNTVYRHHGLPRKLISDRDARFTSMFWQSLFKKLGVENRQSTAFHQQTDGQTERTNRVINEMLRHWVNHRGNDWDQYLTIVEFAINNAVHHSTGFSPFYLNQGRHPRTISSEPGQELNGLNCSKLKEAITAAREALAKAQTRQAKHYNLRHRDEEFEVGDEVLMEYKNFRLPEHRQIVQQRFLPRFVGPFRIKRKLSRLNYELELPTSIRIHPVIHASLLKKFNRITNTIPYISGNKPNPQTDVETILDERIHYRKKQFLVKWKNQFTNSWENASILPEKHISKYQQSNTRQETR